VSGFHRVVFDTSTLVSAALRVGSTPYEALRQAFSQGEVCISITTISELQRVLSRPKFDRYQPRDVRGAFVDLVRAFAVQVTVSAADEAKVLPACRDPKDNPFLALVLACSADVLVSSDADLLVLNPWRGVPILTPVAYLRAQSPSPVRSSLT
jgi:putative PIN family toxin of toxin-antitoxin system